MPDDLVRVLTTPSIPEGEIAKARLQDEGIPVLVKGEGTGPYRMGPVHLFVPAAFEVQAALVLSATFEDAMEDLAEDAEDAVGDDALERSVDEPDGSGTV